MAELKPMEVIMRIDFVASDGEQICAHAEKVQELIRCKDCKFYKGLAVCMIHGEKCGGTNYFCAWAERRTDGRLYQQTGRDNIAYYA